MADMDTLRSSQARIYFRMQDLRDRYAFLCDFIVSHDVTHNDLIALVKHQIKFEEYHLELFDSLMEVLMRDRAAINEFRKNNPELYPEDCKELYFKLHEAYKEAHILDNIARCEKWVKNREIMFRKARPFKEDDIDDDPPFT
jgi:hypothetical protein